MDYQLHNKIALVSASTAGIGYAIASMFAAEGATVVINGRSNERVEQAIVSIRSSYPTANLIGVAADLGTVNGVAVLTEKVPKVDILVNNLGIYAVKAFNDITDEEWIHMFNINVMSGIRLSRFYLPFMLKENWGRIIFISSESGVQIPSEMIHYGMTKTAQIAIARGLAETTAGTAVTVNSVLPGPTRSEGVEAFIASMAENSQKNIEQIEKEFFLNVRPTSLLRRFTTVEEVASLVCYVSSPLSSGTNGAALSVDGGVVRAIL